MVESFNAGMTEAAGYLESHGVTPVYDENTGQNYGEYTSEVDGRRYQIWLEDQTTLLKPFGDDSGIRFGRRCQLEHRMGKRP